MKKVIKNLLFYGILVANASSIYSTPWSEHNNKANLDLQVQDSIKHDFRKIPVNNNKNTNKNLLQKLENIARNDKDKPSNQNDTSKLNEKEHISLYKKHLDASGDQQNDIQKEPKELIPQIRRDELRKKDEQEKEAAQRGTFDLRTSKTDR